MLSSPRPKDGPPPCQIPGPGPDHPDSGSNSNFPLQLDCNQSPSSSLAKSPRTTSPATPRRRNDIYILGAESGSPTKQRSPLRQSVTYAEPPETPGARPTSWDSVISPVVQLGSPIMTLTGGDRRLTGGERRRSNWFARGNTPSAEDHGQENALATMRTGQPSTPQNISPSTSSRFGFFSSSVSALKGLSASPTTMTTANNDDQLINLDIQAALFPSGSPSDRDTFSPAAFKNLQMTATGLLEKYQSAYQQRTTALRELKAEREAESDTKDEAEMRVHHLKLQLEEMARKATEQESIMQALMEELNKEKKLRIQARQARENARVASDASTVSEDLNVEQDQRHKWRESGTSMKSDVGFDTDEDSTESASVFSRSRSPTIAASVSEASTIDVPVAQPNLHNFPTPRLTPKQVPQVQMNALQKLIRGMSHDNTKAEDLQRGLDVCRNCQGQDANVAWDTVSLLRDENRGLKHRVGELEVAVEGALDAVNGLTL